jgi:hypothetical protein
MSNFSVEGKTCLRSIFAKQSDVQADTESDHSSDIASEIVQAPRIVR